MIVLLMAGRLAAEEKSAKGRRRKMADGEGGSQGEGGGRTDAGDGRKREKE